MKRAPSNAEWQKWGRDDPFYGVAAWPGRQRGGSNPWTAHDFYALGQSTWVDFRRRWVAYGLDFGRVVDIGWGAGRLTKAMAADFEKVIGVDVSDGMLEVGRANLLEANVEFRLGDGIQMPVETSSADAAFSAHVFQHLDSLALAHTNFSEIARVLKPGATMMVHLPVVMPPTGIPGALGLLAGKNRVDDLRATLRRWRRAPLMRWMQYPWPWLVRELPRLGLVEVELAVFLSAGSGIQHACVMARRSATTP